MGIVWLHINLPISSLISCFMYCSAIGLLLRKSSMVKWCWASNAFLYCWFLRIAASDCFWRVMFEWCLPHMGLRFPFLEGLPFWFVLMSFILFFNVILIDMNWYELNSSINIHGFRKSSSRIWNFNIFCIYLHKSNTTY